MKYNTGGFINKNDVEKYILQLRNCMNFFVFIIDFAHTYTRTHAHTPTNFYFFFFYNRHGLFPTKKTRRF